MAMLIGQCSVIRLVLCQDIQTHALMTLSTVQVSSTSTSCVYASKTKTIRRLCLTSLPLAFSLCLAGRQSQRHGLINDNLPYTGGQALRRPVYR